MDKHMFEGMVHTTLYQVKLTSRSPGESRMYYLLAAISRKNFVFRTNSLTHCYAVSVPQYICVHALAENYPKTNHSS